MPATSLSDRFQKAYNVIDDHLKATVRKRTFGERVSASTDPIVVERRNDLLAFAEVRNLMIHRYGNRRYEVEPSAWLVAEIEHIAEVLTRPPTVDEVLGLRDVATCAPGDDALAVSRLMLARDYSQVPVYEDGRYRAVLTFETLARWMTSRLDEIGLLEAEPVSRVLGSAEVEPLVVFGKRTTSVTEVLDIFTSNTRKGVYVSAVLLSEYASPTSPPTNIVVAADIPVLRAAIERR